jgi:hypothetical protein
MQFFDNFAEPTLKEDHLRIDIHQSGQNVDDNFSLLSPQIKDPLFTQLDDDNSQRILNYYIFTILNCKNLSFVLGLAHFLAVEPFDHFFCQQNPPSFDRQNALSTQLY